MHQNLQGTQSQTDNAWIFGTGIAILTCISMVIIGIMDAPSRQMPTLDAVPSPTPSLEQIPLDVPLKIAAR